MANKKAGLRIALVRSVAQGDVQECLLQLPVGSTVHQALQAVGWMAGPSRSVACGVWGRVCSIDTVLRDGDRVELYRPLTVDPKVARRERFVRQGARGAGLFAVRRPNSKSGY